MKDVIKQTINILRAAPPSGFSVVLICLVALCLARLLMFVLRLLELTVANVNKPTFDFNSISCVHIRQGSLFQRIKHRLHLVGLFFQAIWVLTHRS